MDSFGTWSTKEQILKDIPRTSWKTSNNQDIDANFLVVGNAPPPRVHIEEECDMFGNTITNESVTATTSQYKPYLEGIKTMLKWEKEYSEKNANNTNFFDVPKPNCVTDRTKPSKLNPCVKEFIPKFQTCTRHSSEMSINSQSDVQETSLNADTHIDRNKVTNEDEQRHDSLDGIITRLKKQIADGAKSDSYELKKQKNVAIATLLKIYSKNVSPKSTETIELKTPDFYENKKDLNSTITHSGLTTVKSVQTLVPRSTSPEPSSSSLKPKLNGSLPTVTSSETTYENNIIQNSTEKPIDPEMRRSIETVNRWLDGSNSPFTSRPPRKSPALSLGPIAFKRKELDGAMSPVSNIRCKEENPGPSTTGKEYKPSDFASALVTKYEGRKKIKEHQKASLNWSNLEEHLKQRDKILAEKSAKQNE